MTDIRELLREAGADIDVAPGDPVEQIRRGVARRRRGQVAIVAVIAVVAAAIAIPIALTRSDSRGIQPIEPPAPTRPIGKLQWLEPSAGDAVYGFGAVWALQCCNVASGHSWVDKLNPTTGQRIKRITIGGPTSQIAAGAGQVWVIGSNPGGGGPSSITVINPHTRDKATAQVNSDTSMLTDPKAEPHAIAFAAGSAWVTFPLLDQVRRYTWETVPQPPHIHGWQLAESDVSVPGGPSDIATTPDGEIWVQEANAGKVVQIDPRTQRVIAYFPWKGDIYGPTARESHGLVGTTATNVWVALDAYDLARPPGGGPMGCQGCVYYGYRVPGQIRDVVSTRAGVFVWRTESDGSGVTSFWSNRTLSRAGPRPTTSIPYGGPLSPDASNTGVIIGVADRGIAHWTPTG
ncbi:MAG: hypothetical protein ACTHK4_14535 [Mycobacteriales bacterium]